MGSGDWAPGSGDRDTPRAAAHLQRDHLLGHGSLHGFVHLRVLDPQATEDDKSFQKLLVVAVEGLDFAGVLLHLIDKLANPYDDPETEQMLFVTITVFTSFNTFRPPYAVSYFWGCLASPNKQAEPRGPQLQEETA